MTGFFCSLAISTQKCSSIGNNSVGCLVSFLNLDEGIMNIMRHSRLSRTAFTVGTKPLDKNL